MSKPIWPNRDRHCDPRIKSGVRNPGERRWFDRAITARERELARNAKHKKRANERAQCNEAPDAAISSGNRGFCGRERLAARISGALHRRTRRLGAKD